ncbi:alcohol dehydrogenase, partial [Erwinia amylovora]
KLASRRDIAPQVEFFPLSKFNEALEHVRAGKANFRVVLKAAF